MVAIDFTSCPRVPGRAYNGANGKKIAVSFEGARSTTAISSSRVRSRGFARRWTGFCRASANWISSVFCPRRRI